MNRSNIILIVAYDGTPYLGWQKTSMGPSVEDILQKTIEKILQQPITLQAASRTDAGVHALGQVVNFIWDTPKISLPQLQRSLNGLLPNDISILKIDEAPPSFHPTLDCQGKEYHYYICNSSFQLPQFRLYSWHYFYPLDISLMQEAASVLLGEHDFATFCNQKKNENYSHTTRHLTQLDLISLEGSRMRFEITGNHFLYKMVRNLVGTLAYVGCGKIRVDELLPILISKNRSTAGVTAPAHGLHLAKVLF